jgi:hypothetical protein
MDIYSSVLPTMQRDAVEKLAKMMRCQVSVPARQSGSGTSTTLSRGFSWRR